MAPRRRAYTVGAARLYRQLLGSKTPVYKMGRMAPDYEGGYVFRTASAARRFAEANAGYSVFEIALPAPWGESVMPGRLDLSTRVPDRLMVDAEIVREVSPHRQCAKCPWLVTTDPRTIPGGYCEAKHRGLRLTIATSPEQGLGGDLRLMACHESSPGQEVPCVGWLHNQLGPGNNVALRLAAFDDAVNTDYELIGEQHERFEDTLPTFKD